MPTDTANSLPHLTRQRLREAVEPLLISDVQGARMAGISRRSWHRLRSAGKLPPSIKLGRSIRWRRADVEQWITWGCPDAKMFSAMQAGSRRLKLRKKAACDRGEIMDPTGFSRLEV